MIHFDVCVIAGRTHRTGPGGTAYTAYYAACAHARLGDPERRRPRGATSGRNLLNGVARLPKLGSCYAAGRRRQRRGVTGDG